MIKQEESHLFFMAAEKFEDRPENILHEQLHIMPSQTGERQVSMSKLTYKET